ncbi:MAG: tryptophan synthase subunit beta [Erysipelotrichaceae bacterium]|nr:tryptophan synthase subunit beta [Erysipelotrichaceae bacterium]
MMNYGMFGGQYVPQNLKEKLNEIETVFNAVKEDAAFMEEYFHYLKTFVGRPSPLFLAKNLTQLAGGANIYLKREDLNHTGAHKINNAIGQILVAKRMNKTHIIAETGAGSHGVATATVCALFNMKCTIFMGQEDIRRQKANVDRMILLGAEVRAVTKGTGTLKEAVDEAFEYLVEHPDVFYLIGSAVGPAPYPEMVKHFQKIIGEETKRQMLEFEKKLPKAVIACVGGGSNSIGMFTDFMKEDVTLYGVEAAGKGIATGDHASAVALGKIGILHGMKTYIMEKEAYSISAGLDYPGIGPEHAYLHQTNRVIYDSITDEEAVEAFKLLSRTEGIIPALESSHAVAYALKIAKNYTSEDSLVVCLSGRGDKDMDTVLSL